MNQSLKSLIACAVVAITMGGLLILEPLSVAETAPSEILQASGELKWYKGNIHTHTLWSDGDDYPEMISLWYKDRGYDFLCITDHNILANREKWTDVLKNKGNKTAYDKLKARFPKGWVEERTREGRLEVRLKTFSEIAAELGEPGKFLLIQGEEITDGFKNLPIHMNATNIQSLIPPLHGESVSETMQNNVNAVIAQSERTGEPILIHLNHPNFGYGVTAEDLMRVRGENFFEVYNGHPGVRNSGDARHASTERIWDIILTKRIAELDMDIMYGLGTDDGHNYHTIPSRKSEPGRGWVVVLVDKLNPGSLVRAMEQGKFYASSGVSLEKVISSKTGLSLEVKPEEGVTYTVEFIGTRKGYDPKGTPVLAANGKPIRTTLKYSDDIGTVLKKVSGVNASYEFTGEDLYVRAVVTSSKKHPNPAELGEFERAWAQPVKGPAAPKRVED